MTCAARRHGTRNAYKRLGCRCPEARQVMRPVWRQRPSRAVQADPIAVQRTCSGHRPTTLHRSERAAAIQDLHDRGLSAREIAALVGVAKRTVERHRAAGRRTNRTEVHQ